MCTQKLTLVTYTHVVMVAVTIAVLAVMVAEKLAAALARIARPTASARPASISSAAGLHLWSDHLWLAGLRLLHDRLRPASLHLWSTFPVLCRDHIRPAGLVLLSDHLWPACLILWPHHLRRGDFHLRPNQPATADLAARERMLILRAARLHKPTATRGASAAFFLLPPPVP